MAFGTGRNASENPAGIETAKDRKIGSISDEVATHQKTQQGLKLFKGYPVAEGQSRNASENPAGIETY